MSHKNTKRAHVNMTELGILCTLLCRDDRRLSSKSIRKDLLSSWSKLNVPTYGAINNALYNLEGSSLISSKQAEKDVRNPSRGRIPYEYALTKKGEVFTRGIVKDIDSPMSHVHDLY